MTNSSAGQAGIRKYCERDKDALGAICVLTGNAGADATGRHSDEELLPYLYLYPYLAHGPSWAWVSEIEGKPVGYLVATPDVVAFKRWWLQEWAPILQERFPKEEVRNWSEQDRSLLRDLLRPEMSDWEGAYPAALHVNLLDEAQGRGFGKSLIEVLTAALRSESVPGVALGVDARNENAIGFYKHLGFKVLQEQKTAGETTGYTMGKDALGEG